MVQELMVQELMVLVQVELSWRSSFGGAEHGIAGTPRHRTVVVADLLDL